MSFSSEIKEILCKTKYECPGCRRSELVGFFVFPARLSEHTGHVLCSQPMIAERMSNAIYDELGIKVSTEGRKIIFNDGDAKRLMLSLMDSTAINSCCSAAYARGAFLASGSVSDPAKEYHLEFSTRSSEEVRFFLTQFGQYGSRAKTAKRRDKNIIYLKDSTSIAEIIGYMSAGRAGLEILSIQVEKELNSSTQRKVNCDSANLSKQAKASARQIAAVKKIKAAYKWNTIPEVLREIGELRLKYPDMSIEELGKMTDPQIGKSGVNHRLKRLIEYADSIGI